MPRIIKGNSFEKPESESETEVVTPIPEPVAIVNKPTEKPKKQRSQAQIDATNRMREQLKLKREADTKIKETVKLEHDELKKKIKKKLFSTRVKEQVEQKIKEIAVLSESESESESDESEIEYVPVKKEKIRKKPVKEASHQPVPNTPSNKQYFPSSTQPQYRAIKFF